MWELSKSGEPDAVQRDIAVARCRMPCRRSNPEGNSRNCAAERRTEANCLRTCRRAAGADFVKTSTGFGAIRRDGSDVALMREVVGPEMGVKASGGIRTLADLRKMVAAGASRIGASASVNIIKSVE